MRARLLGLLLLMVACTAETADRVPLDGRSDGCGDAFLYRVSSDDGTVLSLYWPGAATGTWEANDTVKTITGEVGSKGLEVRMEVGRNLGPLICNDVIEKEPIVERTYLGTSGSVTMTLTVADEADQRFPLAHAVISDLVLRTEDGLEIEVAQATFRPVSVGWYPG